MSVKRLIDRIIDILYLPAFRKILPLQTFRYGFCGGSNMVFDYLLFYVLYNFILCERIVDLGFVAISPHIASYLIEFPIVFFTGFWLNKNIVFVESERKTHVQLGRYFLVVCGSVVINYICLKLFVDYLDIIAEIAKIFTIIISVIYSYLMQKYFTFGDANR